MSGSYFFSECWTMASSNTYNDRIELAVFGYIRNNSQRDVPDGVMGICFDYYPKIEVVFDVFLPSNSECVSEDGMTIQIPESMNCEYRSFASSIGWNTGIHCWTLKPMDGSKPDSIGIGIVSNEDLKSCAEQKNFYFLWSKNRESIAYCKDAKRIFVTKEGSNSKLVDCKDHDDCDEITIVLDCDDWKLRYYAKDKPITEELDVVDTTKTYHAVFSTFDLKYYAGSKYHVIETPSGIKLNSK